MQISVMKCPHQCQVKPVRAGQAPLIHEAEGEEDELERRRRRVQVLVVQEAEDLEEVRRERVQVLHNCLVNITEIHEPPTYLHKRDV